MEYQITPMVEGVPLDQLAAAALKVRHILESRLGGAKRVETCFLASGKPTRAGPEALFPQEATDAAAWHVAFDEARAAVAEMLGRPVESVNVMVKLGLPIQ